MRVCVPERERGARVSVCECVCVCVRARARVRVLPGLVSRQLIGLLFRDGLESERATQRERPDHILVQVDEHGKIRQVKYIGRAPQSVAHHDDDRESLVLVGCIDEHDRHGQECPQNSTHHQETVPPRSNVTDGARGNEEEDLKQN